MTIDKSACRLASPRRQCVVVSVRLQWLSWGQEIRWIGILLAAKPIFIALVMSFLFGMVGHSEEIPSQLPSVSRWYTPALVERGAILYSTHCMSCHGAQAEGTAQWRTLDANGNYPPPPLNGSAHTWHHALVTLEETIAKGGLPNGGVMPGFAQVLSANDMRATIAYFQSKWSDKIYARWQKIDAR